MNLDAVQASQAALLVIDMQNAFIHDAGTLGISGVDVVPAQQTVPVVRELAAAFQAAGLPVIWTKQIHLERDAARGRKVLPSHTSKRKQVSALSGSWDSDFVDEVKDFVTDSTYVVVKHRFGGFYETRMQALLDMLGVQALFVVGVTANACVETTLREAYLRDYDVVAVTDGIAAVRPAWIDTAHAVWSQYFGVLAHSREVLDWLMVAQQPAAISVHHILLETSNLEVSEKFYVDVLGFTVRRREEFRGRRNLVVTHQGLGLTNGGSPTRGTIEHLCFSARDVDGLAARATAAGHRIVRGPGPGPYGYTVYIEDPDGHEIELFDVDRG